MEKAKKSTKCEDFFQRVETGKDFEEKISQPFDPGPFRMSQHSFKQER